MNSGENINNAFKVVFKTLQSVQDLMECCTANYDDRTYHLPIDRFLRYSSDQSWEGWIYWSFILVFQRKADGDIMKENDWINAPLYAVEINLDSDTNENEPQIFIAKMEYNDLSTWSKGISPSSHDKIYNPIHKVKFFDSFDLNGKYCMIVPKAEAIEKVNKNYWGFKRAVMKSIPLVQITEENYISCIFGSIEELAMIESNAN